MNAVNTISAQMQLDARDRVKRRTEAPFAVLFVALFSFTWKAGFVEGQFGYISLDVTRASERAVLILADIGPVETPMRS